MKTAIVTGAGSGIGYYTAKELYENGYRVYDFSRTDRCFEGVVHIACDVSKEEEVKRAVGCVIEREGRIDLLINNAGFGISGAVEFTDPEDIQAILNVNLLGGDNLVRACLPHMRRTGAGRVVFVSSAAAIFPIPFQAWYSVSKAAVNAYALSLRNEVRAFGISVCAVLPGDIKTGFTDARKKAHIGDDIYKGRISRAVSCMEKDERGGMDASYAGAYLRKIAERKRVKPLYVIGVQYRLYAFLNRFLPSSVMNFIVGMMYGGREKKNRQSNQKDD